MGYTATSSNGSTYNATSDKAVNFISNASAGSTMTGGDGSKWTKNSDGSTTVVAKDGVTTTFKGNSSGGSSGKSSSSGGSSGKSSSSKSSSSGGSSSSSSSVTPFRETISNMLSSSSSGGSSGGASSSASTGYTAVSSNGSIYNATTPTAINFIENAAPGATMDGGNGSKWVKNADGTTTVTHPDGVTTTFGTPVVQQQRTYSSAGASSPTISPLTNRAPDLQSTLDQWLAAAQEQAKLQADYAVAKGVNDLQRAEEDAKEQFQTQRNRVSAAEAKANDNMALYNERRGDRGGIGAAQYASIANTAAQNQLAVNQAQTKLSTDTARQIADLRAQGEFQKADQLLQLSQTYLQQLINIQQWASEFNLSVDQFNKQLEQWNNEFELKVADLLGNYRGAQTLASQQLDLQRENSAFDNAYKEASLTGIYGGQPTLQARSQLAEAGIALA